MQIISRLQNSIALVEMEPLQKYQVTQNNDIFLLHNFGQNDNRISRWPHHNSFNYLQFMEYSEIMLCHLFMHLLPPRLRLHITLYRVINEECHYFRELICHVMLMKKVHMNMGSIFHITGDMRSTIFEIEL